MCFRRSLFAACLILASSGCQTHTVRLSPAAEKIRGELRAIDPRRDPLAARTRIIDVHTHTFNARYLPLQNILLGKRDVFPPVSWLISDLCAKTLAQALNDRTELAPAAGEPGKARIMPDKEHYHAGFICGILLNLLKKAEDNDAWNKGMSHRDQMEKLDDVADQMNLPERLAVRAAGHIMGMDESLKTVDQRKAMRGLVRFLWMLTQNDAEMTKLFRSDYSTVPMRGEPLMVSHTMDLGPVYAQQPDEDGLLDYARQIRRAEEFQKKPVSGMIYFVAYNPYRDHWSGEKPGDALRIVRSAVEEHGAWGVKVYPPSGYRPAGNSIKRRAFAPLTSWPGKEWDARYASLGKKRDAKMDRRLEELLEWCIEADVPVFVHCGTGEFEARKGYGLYHSNPKYWRQFLESHSQNGEPCRLRLCLGHAGGDAFWFGRGKFSEWGRDVYDLCREFPNVYCEITTHHELLDANRQAWFVNRLITQFEDPAPRSTAKNRFPYRYPFGGKLMYGTDWYLPDAGDRDDVLLATEQAFLHGKLRTHYEDYFSGNALRYLNVRARLDDPKFHSSPAVRDQLEQLLHP